MSCIRALLDGYAPRITQRLAPPLRGPFGALIRAYLPQSWVLVVGEELYTLEVDAQGSCTIAEGRPSSPDVTIEVGHDRLRAALEGGSPRGAPPGPFSVSFQTRKGESAYRFLRSRFGL